VVVVSRSAAGSPPAEVNALADTIRETKEVINESESARRKLLGSLYAINLRMKKISTEKGKLTDELMQSQDGVETVASAIQALETQISKQRLALKKRLRALYKISGESVVGAVFSTTNAYEFDSTLRNLKLISDKDFQMIQSYRENLKTLASQRKKLKSQVERLLLVERRIKKQENLLAQEHHAKSALAATIEKDTRKRMSEIKRLRQSHSTDDAEIAHLLKPSIYEKKGTLVAPVALGTIVKDFGLRIDEKFKFKMSHKGWQIGVARPTTVVATDEGSIVFSGILPAYGATLIVDHGDHYYSIYSGLQKIQVAVGDEVLRAQALAQAETGLYFEIRHFSEPENPASWISAKSSLLTRKNAPLETSPLKTSLEKKQAKADFE
jgi:murein hydrolase activator